MHPAKSVIGFTTLSGLGYGLLIVLIGFSETSIITIPPAWIRIYTALGLLLVTAGLMFSLFHLGHPERAWRAYSQWRTSWLSREGVLATFTYAPVLIWAWYRYSEGFPFEKSHAWGLVSVISCLATVYATSMIYQTLKAIPAWHNRYTVPTYLLFAVVTGAVLFVAGLSAAGIDVESAGRFLAAGLFLCVALKGMYWMSRDKAGPVASVGDATGLGHLGDVRQFEGAHTEENYLMKEMGFRIGRKHARRLHTIFNASFLIGAALSVAGLPWAVLLFVAIGTIAERWLFFAEAKHAVQLYYCESSV